MNKDDILSRLETLDAREERYSNELNDMLASKSEDELTDEDLLREAFLRKKLAKVRKEKNELNKELNKSEKSLGLAGCLSIAAIILSAGVIGYSLGNIINKSKDKSTTSTKEVAPIVSTDVPQVLSTTPEVGNLRMVETPVPTPIVTPAPTSTPAPTATPEPTPEPTATPIPEAAALFSDVTDEEELNAAVDHIYENYIIPMEIDLNDPVFSQSFTKEDVIDMIRVLHGELPIYSEVGKKRLGSTLDRNINLFANIFANKGLGNTLYPTHLSDLCELGTELARYAESYDVIYNAIAAYRAEGNADGVVEMTGLLGSKIWNEWFLHGLYGGYDPYAFEPNEQYLAFLIATSRFNNYVYEYLISNNLTVCIPGCYEANFGSEEVADQKLINVCDLFEAFESEKGMSKNKEVKFQRGAGETYNPAAEAYVSLLAELQEKIDAKKLTLN